MLTGNLTADLTLVIGMPLLAVLFHLLDCRSEAKHQARKNRK